MNSKTNILDAKNFRSEPLEEIERIYLFTNGQELFI